MPDYHGEGDATDKSVRRAIAHGKRMQRLNLEQRIHDALQAQVRREAEEAKTSEATPSDDSAATSPRKQRKRRQRKCWSWDGPENPTRPRKADRQHLSSIKRKLYPGKAYNFNAERAMVQDASARQSIEDYRRAMDEDYGPRKRRKRR